MILSHLPEGPTATVRVSGIVLNEDIPNHGANNGALVAPELILNNFDTMLGSRIGRLIASLFPQDPGRVFKGKKMAGHMGDKFRTVERLEIIETDLENNLLFVKGSVPGAKNAVVEINIWDEETDEIPEWFFNNSFCRRWHRHPKSC